MLRVVIAAGFICGHISADVDTRLWVRDGTTNGNISGCVGVDAFCDSDVNKPVVPDSATRAYISVTATDEIQDMPQL